MLRGVTSGPLTTRRSWDARSVPAHEQEVRGVGNDTCVVACVETKTLILQISITTQVTKLNMTSKSKDVHIENTTLAVNPFKTLLKRVEVLGSLDIGTTPSPGFYVRYLIVTGPLGREKFSVINLPL